MGVSTKVFTDQLITCVDCGQQFTFTAGEQEFYAQKGFQNKPSRCPDCRAARKASRGGSGGGGGGGSRFGGGGGGGGGAQREMFRTTCSSCGGPAEVPFQPRGDKPVYCRDCFQQQRSAY
jgi:CxxC-x17-CxxC domain-containing protein